MRRALRRWKEDPPSETESGAPAHPRRRPTRRNGVWGALIVVVAQHSFGSAQDRAAPLQGMTGWAT